MAYQPLTFGDPRSGYAEIIRNARGVDIIAFRAKANPSNPSGVDDFSEGELAILDGTFPNPLAQKCPNSFVNAAWTVIVGKERSDIRGSRTTSLIIGQGYHLRTSGYNTSLTTYAYGVPLGIKNGLWEPATVGGTPILGMCLSAINPVQTDAERALNRTPFSVIVIEVGPRGYLP